MDQDDIERQIERGRKIAERLRQELNIAESSWAHFEAINGDTEQVREQFRQAMERLPVSNRGLLAAIIRDAIMALWRIVDDPRKHGFPLIEVAKLLSSERLRTVLAKQVKKRAPKLDEDESYADCDAALVANKIDLIMSKVPLQWNTEPKIKALYEWRKEFENLRHNVLAHPGKVTCILQPKVDRIREGHALISELVSAAHHVFVGSPLPSDSLRQLVRSANTFWNYAEVGFIEAANRPSV